MPIFYAFCVSSSILFLEENKTPPKYYLEQHAKIKLGPETFNKDIPFGLAANPSMGHRATDTKLLKNEGWLYYMLSQRNQKQQLELRIILHIVENIN